MSLHRRAVHDRIVSGPWGKIVGPQRAALCDAELTDKWQQFAALSRYGTTIPPRLVKLAILVTSRAFQAPSEWYAHRIEAEKAEIAPPIIKAILKSTVPQGMSKVDDAIYSHSSKRNQRNSVSEAKYNAALTRLEGRKIIELTAIVVYYTMAAVTSNCHEISLPDGAEPAFPLARHLDTPDIQDPHASNLRGEPK